MIIQMVIDFIQKGLLKLLFQNVINQEEDL